MSSCVPGWSALCWLVSQGLHPNGCCLAWPCLDPLDPRLFIGFESLHREPPVCVERLLLLLCRPGPHPSGQAAIRRLYLGLWRTPHSGRGQRGFIAASLQGSLEGLRFHAWDHPVRNTLSQASCNGAISTLVSSGQDIS